MEENLLSMGFSNLPEILKLFFFGPLFTLKLLRTEKTFCSCKLCYINIFIVLKSEIRRLMLYKQDLTEPKEDRGEKKKIKKMRTVTLKEKDKHIKK